jgi:hypothetical protein
MSTLNTMAHLVDDGRCTAWDAVNKKTFDILINEQFIGNGKYSTLVWQVKRDLK